MKKYLDIEIEREHSKYPRGLKHFSKKELFENTLFDIDLIWHKIKCIVKGHDDGERNKKGSEEKGTCSTKEILRGLMFGLLYEDRHTENRDRENRGIERLYLEMEKGESEEYSESGERCSSQSRNE